MGELQRHRLYPGEFPPDEWTMKVDPKGEWVRYPDAQAAIAAAVKEKDVEITFLKADRDEWREQHENLLSVRRTDIACQKPLLDMYIKALERAESAERRIRDLEATIQFAIDDAVDGKIRHPGFVRLREALLAARKEKPE